MTNSLYGVHPVSSSDLNMQAHPGGGTEVNEVPSFEGLVEDQFEKHLRHLEIAFKEPVAIRMARLSRDLEHIGLEKIAYDVDEHTYNFYVTADARTVQLKVAMKKVISRLTALLRREDVTHQMIFNILDEMLFEVDKQNTDWRVISDHINSLKDPDVSRGRSWYDVSSSDVADMTDSGKKLYFKLLRQLSALAKSALSEKEDTLTREESPHASSSKQDAQALAIQMKNLISFIDYISREAGALAAAAKRLGAEKEQELIQRINFVFGNPDLQSTLRDSYTAYNKLQSAMAAKGITEIEKRMYQKQIRTLTMRVEELDKFLKKLATEFGLV